jgi:hypothetical protein
MDLSALEPALQDWVATLTGVPRAACLWENAPRVQHAGQLVLLSWVSMVGVGMDATEWDYDADAGVVDPLTELTPVVQGQRRAALQVSVEAHDQRPGVNATALAQRVVDRAQAPSSLAALAAANAGLASVGTVRRTDYRVDGRMVARATVEVGFNLTSHFIDTAGRTATIDAVEIDATVEGSSGSDLPDTADGGGTFHGPE